MKENWDSLKACCLECPELNLYSQATPSLSRSSLGFQPGLPACSGAAPAAGASLQLVYIVLELGGEAVLLEPLEGAPPPLR